MKRRWEKALAGLLLGILLGNILPGQEKSNPDSLLSLERIFDSRDFDAERFGPARWMKDGQSYTTVEASPAVADDRDIVLYIAATGKREVLIARTDLCFVPGKMGVSTPLPTNCHDWGNEMSPKKTVHLDVFILIILFA